MSIRENDEKLDFLLGKINGNTDADEKNEASEGWITTSKNDAEHTNRPTDDPEDSGGSDLDFENGEDVAETTDGPAWKGREAAEEAANIQYNYRDANGTRVLPTRQDMWNILSPWVGNKNTCRAKVTP